MPLPNVYINSTRGGSPIYWQRFVQIDVGKLRRYPSLPGADALQEATPLLFATLYDDIDTTPNMGWQPADQIAVTGDADDNALPIGTRYGVYTAAPVYGAVPHVTATLITIPVYPSAWPYPLLIDRLVQNGSNQGTPTDVDGTMYVYLRDLSNDLTLTGQALEFRFRLVCDGSVDIREGDRLYGLPLVTSNRPQRIATAQHVALHQLAGWSYKTAFVKVLE